jgi:phosphoglycerol transferase
MKKIEDKKTWFDLGLVLVLNLLISVAWCTANFKWSKASWKTPSSYLTAEQSDVLTTLATLKAVTEGDFRPFQSKIIKRLGAPEVANWNDFPIIEEVPLSFFGILAKWFGLFAGLNLSLLLGHFLAGTCFFLVARYRLASPLASFLGALAFGLAPFLFAQSPHHIVVQYAWHIPLFLLVWEWVFEEGGIKLGSPRFWFSFAIGFLSGIQNIYYTYIFCQLVVLGAAIQFFRDRCGRNLFSSALVIISSFFGISLMNLDTWFYRLKEGPNLGVLVRDYRWLEVYALKLVDLVIPLGNHQVGFLANLGRHYRSQTILNDEGSYLGIIGISCLLLLVVTALTPFLRKSPKSPPLSFWQILWIFLFFSTGGLNAIQGVCGVTFFRTGCRYSIVILAALLLHGVRKFTELEKAPYYRKFVQSSRYWTICIAVLGAIFIFIDQVPKSNSEEEDQRNEFLVSSDKEFTKAMEASLPKGAMVFQLPIMGFPESPAPGIDPYNHLRPYLYSESLRFSFGNDKGRSSDKWQIELANAPLNDLISQIVTKGFAGLYINTNGYPDRGEQILTIVRDLGYAEHLVSKSKDLVFFKLTQALKKRKP